MKLLLNVASPPEEMPILCCRLTNIGYAPDSLAPGLCPNRHRYAVTEATPISIVLPDQMALPQR